MRQLRSLWLLALVAGCGGGGGNNNYVPVPPDIVFVSNRDGNDEIYRVDSNGRDERRLTNDPARDFQCSFSQDNAKILFVSDRTGDYDIFVIGSDGVGLTQLTSDPLPDNCPRFNFDGSKIVFQRGTGAGREIWSMDATGANQQQLTTNAFEDSEPSWTPAGRIIFTSTRTGNQQLFIMDADGGNQQALTTDPTAEAYQADTIADGSKIAFILDKGGLEHVAIMNSDGTGIVDKGHVATEFWPRWSPDGTRLVVTVSINGNEDLYRMLADGSGWTKLTGTPFADEHGDW